MSFIDVKALATTLSPSRPLTSSKDKTLDEGTLEKLMRGMKELKVEMGVFMKNTKSSDLVQPLAHRLSRLAANLIANSYG